MTIYIYNMKTVKLPIQQNTQLLEGMRIFSSIVRMAFNGFQKGLSDKEIRAKINSLYNVNCWLVESAIIEAKKLYSVVNKNKVIFGGKYNLIRYMRGLITKEQFKYNRMQPICSIGAKNYQGNRLIEFDLPNNRIIYKPSRKEHIVVNFRPVKKKLANELAKVQELSEQQKIPVTVKLTDKHLFITYDETIIYNEAYKGLKYNRVLGIDMNPNYIGVSVIEFSKNDELKVLHKAVYDLSALTSHSGESSQHKKSKYLTNKLKHETLAIAHEINRLIDYWKCSKLSIEDLAIKYEDHNKGKHLNHLCNNSWKRQLFVNKLKMLAGIYRYELVEVNPAYSSIVGNFAYGNENTPDMIAASIEIARRAYKKFEKEWFYPKFNVERLDERWKQTLSGVKTWKNLFLKVKESKLKYRFLLSDYIGNAVLSKLHYKGAWTHSTFT